MGESESALYPTLLALSLTLTSFQEAVCDFAQSLPMHIKHLHFVTFHISKNLVKMACATHKTVPTMFIPPSLITLTHNFHTVNLTHHSLTPKYVRPPTWCQQYAATGLKQVYTHHTKMVRMLHGST